MRVIDVLGPGAIALMMAAAVGQEIALPSYQLRVAAATPAARHSHAIAWDAGRQVAVMFGGLNGSTVIGSTWEFDGANWTQRSPAIAPPARYDAGLAYDRSRQRVVMFGGGASGDLGDTWEWDGTNWFPIATAHAPSPRRMHTMVFDEARGVTVVFGGTLGAPGTWTYDGVDWTLHSVPDPGSRESATAAYSPFTRRVLLFGGNLGGQRRNDLWQWDGAAWTQLPQLPGPPPMVYHAMAYDRHLRGLVLMPGNWFYDGSWRQLPGAQPPGRQQSAMAHMDSLARTVMFGGAQQILPSRQLFELDDMWETSYAAQQVPFGIGCGTPALSLVPSATSPRLGASWSPRIDNVPSPGVAFLAVGLSRDSFAGVPLPLSLDSVGMSGCVLLQDTAATLGLPTSPAVGGSSTLVVAIPSAPELLGFVIHLQAWALAPGVNAAGVIASGGLAVTVGQ